MHRLLRFCRGFLPLALVTLVPALFAREEHWVKIEAPYFTIYSEGWEKETRDWAAKFEEFRVIMTEVLHVSPTRLPPVQVVIVRHDSGLKPFKFKHEADNSMEWRGFTVHSPLLTCITLSLDGDDEFTGFAIFNGGARWFMNGLDAPGPEWFQRGLAEVFSVYDTDGNEALVGKDRKQHVEWIEQNGFMPMDRFLALDPHTLPPDQTARLTKAWQAQCWALVHYLLWGRGPEGMEQLRHYLTLCKSLPPDQAFAQAFPITPKRLGEELHTYMHYGHNHVLHVKFDRAEVTKDFKVSQASAAEIQVAKGNILMLNDAQDAAHDCYNQAKALAPGAPGPFEGLAIQAYQAGDMDEAVRQWQAAAAAGSKNFMVYFQLAAALMQVNPGFLDGRAGNISPQLSRQVANYLEHAIKLNPYYLKPFEYLPFVLSYYAQPTPDDPPFLELGLQLKPGNSLLEASLAAVALKSGRLDEARARLEKLTAPGRALSPEGSWLVKYVQTRLGSADDLAQVDSLLAEKKGEEAEQLIVQLLHRDITADIRVKLTAQRTYAGELQVLAEASQDITDERWTDAETLVRPLVESASTPAVQQEARGLLEKITPHLRTGTSGG